MLYFLDVFGIDSELAITDSFSVNKRCFMLAEVLFISSFEEYLVISDNLQYENSISETISSLRL